MRPMIVAGNWKLNGSIELAKSLSEALAEQTVLSAQVTCCLFPSFIMLESMVRLFESKSNITVGAQNCAAYPSGAYTGEVSVDMLRTVGVNTVLVGHSERRHVFLETQKDIERKVQLAAQQGLKVFLCVGETLEQREQGLTDEVLHQQLAFLASKPELVNSLVIAYEPVWAIGTGQTATPEQAQAAHAFIRNFIYECSASAADRIQILYGGSVTPETAVSLFEKSDIDGGLIGGASLTVDSFMGVIKCTK